MKPAKTLLFKCAESKIKDLFVYIAIVSRSLVYHLRCCQEYACLPVIGYLRTLIRIFLDTLVFHKFTSV